MKKKEMIYIVLILSIINITFVTIGLFNILDEKYKYVYVDIDTGEQITIDQNNEKTVVINEELNLIRESVVVLDDIIGINNTISDSGINVDDIERIEEQNIENIKQNIQSITGDISMIEYYTQTILDDLVAELEMLNNQLYDLENNDIIKDIIPDKEQLSDKEQLPNNNPDTIESWFESLPNEQKQQIIDQNNIWYPQPSGYDEQYTSGVLSYKSGGGGPPMTAHMESSVRANTDSSLNIGFSTGGAKDISNFRENIRNGYLPSLYDITYEGLFYDYYFDTNNDIILQKSCENLFCPAYTNTVTYDPFSNEKQYYMSVGLNSNIKESDFERNNLNVVIVLDVSGSMESLFDRYYYDRSSTIHGEIILKERGIEIVDREEYKRKIQIATESIVSLTKHLTPEDRLGIILFSSDSHVARPLSSMVGVDEKQLKRNILGVVSGGGTNMESGITTAQNIYEHIPTNDYIPSDLRNDKPYDNRIIFLTDAQPNKGSILSDSGFKNLILDLETDDNIYTTMVGIGVDFNAELVQAMTNEIRGANYYSVHSASDFKQRLDDEFAYMVTPLVFDLNMILTSGNFVIDSIYGVPGVDNNEDSPTNGKNIISINTLFPSASIDGEVRGGIILLKLSKVDDTIIDDNVTLEVSYLDKHRTLYSERENISITTTVSNDTNAVEKGILLVQYADIMKSWIMEQRIMEAHTDIIPGNTWYKDGIYETYGTIQDFIEFNNINLSQYERTSIPLDINDDYRKIFTDFTTYMNNQSDILGDDTLQQEVEMLKLLVADP